MGIVGDGAMGTVCAILLASRGHQVALWSRNPEHARRYALERRNLRHLPDFPIPDSVNITHDGEEVLADKEIVVTAVPCQYIRGVWQSLPAGLAERALHVSVAKGLEVQTLLTPITILREVVRPGRAVCLSGPCIAPEVAAGLPATLVAASQDAQAAHRVQEVFSCSTFRVYTNTDPCGVELAGATKNVVAIAAGIVDGLRLGHNAKAALLTRGLVEITRLGVSLGARSDTFKGLAGMGDLITTCFSPVGRNRTAGQRIGQGASTDEVVRSTPSVIEGIATTRSVLALAARQRVEMPITQAIHGVLFGGVPPLDAIQALMTRQLRAE